MKRWSFTRVARDHGLFVSIGEVASVATCHFSFLLPPERSSLNTRSRAALDSFGRLATDVTVLSLPRARVVRAEVNLLTLWSKL